MLSTEPSLRSALALVCIRSSGPLLIGIIRKDHPPYDLLDDGTLGPNVSLAIYLPRTAFFFFIESGISISGVSFPDAKPTPGKKYRFSLTPCACIPVSPFFCSLPVCEWTRLKNLITGIVVELRGHSPLTSTTGSFFPTQDAPRASSSGFHATSTVPDAQNASGTVVMKPIHLQDFLRRVPTFSGDNGPTLLSRRRLSPPGNRCV